MESSALLQLRMHDIIVYIQTKLPLKQLDSISLELFKVEKAFPVSQH